MQLPEQHLGARIQWDVKRDIEMGDTHFSPARAITLFRILQKALTGVTRHAEAAVTCWAATWRFILQITIALR